MDDYGIRWAKDFSLEQALAMLDDNDDCSRNVKDVTIFPPETACAEITDEDSGDEDFLTMDNLPGSQLQAPAEIKYHHEDDGFSSDDDIPLSHLLNIRVSQENEEIGEKTIHTKKSKKKRVYKWIKQDLVSNQNDFEPAENFHNLESLVELFSRFFDCKLLELIVAESNKYAQKKIYTQKIEMSEIKCFIGVLILSGYVQVPRRRIFWEREKDGHNDLVSEAITRDKFEYIMSNIHFCDNDDLDKNDRFAKIRPLFTDLNKKFIENAILEEMHCVDEAMVPYFGRHGCKQYIHGKPIRYGYKLRVEATRLGYVNWFEPYQGALTNISNVYADFGVGGGVVLEYADVLRNKWVDRKIHIFFDNFFTSIPLIEKLTDKSFYATGTVRENRLSGHPLLDSKIMKKEMRGTYDFKKIEDLNIIAVKWHDNSIVSLCSSFAGVEPIHSVKRYSQKEKKNIQVTQPHLIHLYNANMGGVARSDQNISLYRTSIRGKKWYFPLITHCIDMSIHNAWQLHRKNGGDLDQLKFRRFLATTLLVQNKKAFSYSKGRPSASEGANLRYDRLDHLIIPQDKQTRCGLCHERAKTRCSKCNVGVHVKCFIDFHTK